MKRFKEMTKDPLQMLFFVLPFIFGLYYEFAAYITGIALGIFLCKQIHKNKVLYFTKSIPAILSIVAYLFYFLSIFFAVDKGMAVAGFFKMLPIPLFLIVLMQCKEKQRWALFEVIPFSGIIMLLISAVFGLFEGFNQFFYSAGRLGGFFQYSNAFALYLLLGCVVLLSNDQVFEKKFRLGGAFLLFAGILLTGSRFVFVLAIITIIYFIVIKTDIRKSLVIFVSVGILAAVLLTIITGYYENIGRFLTIGIGESTFVGRFIYYKDAIGQITKHPFGLGYMGYFYAQPSFQTAVYSVRYVHNDFLQMALDIGIIPTVLWIVSLIMSLFSKHTHILQKQLLILIVAASLFDFHLQFIIISLIMIQTLDIGEPFPIHKKNALRCGIGIIGTFVVLWAIMATAFFMDYMENRALALKLYPWNTDARIKQLMVENKTSTLETTADLILKQNKHIALAYEAKAIIAQKNKDLDSMVSYEIEALKNEPYEINAYERYLEMLSVEIEAANAQKDWKTLRQLAGEALKIPKMLDAVKTKTDSRAYAIDEKPELQLDQSYQIYLEQLKAAIK